VLWHVLEHLEDPAAALRRIREWLAPGGVLLVAVPNLESVQARIGRDRWFQQDVPRHLVHFTPAGVSSLLARCGFVRQRRSHRLTEQDVVAMWQTVLNRLTRAPNIAYALVKRRVPRGARADVILSVTVGACLAPLAFALESAAAVAHRGGSIVVQAWEA
jgi:hypothetical protein